MAALRELLATLEPRSAAHDALTADIDGIDLEVGHGEVTSAASQSGESAKTMLTAANELAEQSKALSSQVDGFLANIRAS